MVHQVSIEEFMEYRQKLPVFDVRSPGEYKDGHIPGAYNLPLFDNDERRIVGTLYKSSGREAAVYEGLGIAGKKLQTYVKKALQLTKTKEVLIHCWRGGMRSESMAWLLSTAGFYVHLLAGGYKTYRKYIRRLWEQKSELYVLAGKTGSGKTEILQYIQEKGQQILDLEKIACHKGSAFGAIGQQQQPTNEQFENNLADQWIHLNLQKPVWIEDESLHIGRVCLPNTFYIKKQTSKTILLEVPKSLRIQRLKKDYAVFPKEQLIESIAKITKRLGGQNAKKAIESVLNDDFTTAIDIVLGYYDKAYSYDLTKKDSTKIYQMDCNIPDPKTIAEQVIRNFLKGGNLAQ
ncbi:MAG: tRNA 2-selenouridine(34) synthase MnmH [Bacteroidota bacterium]